MILYSMCYRVTLNGRSRGIFELKCLNSPAFVVNEKNAGELINAWNKDNSGIYELIELQSIDIKNTIKVYRDGVPVYIDNDSASDIIDVLRDSFINKA